MFWPGVYGVQTTIYFPLVTAGGTDFLTGATDGGTDCDIIKDGGTSAVATNDFAEEGNGWYSLVLTGTEMEATVIKVSIIDAATKAYEDQAILVHTGLSHQVDALEGIEKYQVNNASTTPLATAFEADRQYGRSEEATADHFNGRNIVFLDGNLRGQMTDITDYAQQNTRGFFTVTALTEAPADNDFFLVL
jgi:hypothetical protein